jgi:dTDP-4-dehydrorhamnose 3,5-epimerase
MRFGDTPLPGVVVIELDRYVDVRGAFARTFCETEFSEQGLPTEFPQCNISYNGLAGTLRGLHFNVEPFGESKIVRCVRGTVHDVVVDLRPGSVTRFKSFGIDLSADNGKAMFIPSGFAHGFLTIEDSSDVHYHMGAHYRPEAARGLRWNDPALTIDWPIPPQVLSEADAGYPDIDVENFDITSHGS